MENTTFWILWAATLLLAGWVVVDAVRKPRKLLEWPVLCSIMWLYFYVYMAHDAVSQFSFIITPKAFVLGQLMPLLSLAATLYGWNLAKHKSVQRPQGYAKLDNRLLIWAVGMALIFTGALGGYMVQAAREVGGFDYENTSAYVYLLFYVGYPGIALSLWVASRSKGTRKILLLSLTLAAMAAFLYPHVSYLRRGPTFPAILLLLMVPPLATRKAPNPAVYLTGLLLLGVVMLAYLPLRKVIYNQGTWKEAFSGLSLEAAVTERGKNIYDNEFINNCHTIEALSESGKYQYGTGHGSLFLHWIPSSLWESKPALGEGWYTHEELFLDIEESAGVPLLVGTGAAFGGVADTFVQYGYLTPLFYLLLSYLLSKAYWKGRNEGNIFWIHGYIATVCASHWLISQGFAAAFVPVLAFLIIPLVVLRFIGQVRLATAKAGRLKQPKSATGAEPSVAPLPTGNHPVR